MAEQYGHRVWRRFAHVTTASDEGAAQCFSRPVLIAVVHVLSVEQTLRNCNIALSSGVDGVMLISHGNGVGGSRLQVLAASYAAAREAFTNSFIGVNPLPMQPMAAFAWCSAHCPEADCVWLDNAFTSSPPVAERIARSREGVYDGIYMGGVAFKHQDAVHPQQDNAELSASARMALSGAASCAKRFVDIIVTSGTRTGEQPSLQKVEAMASSCCPLAASGAGLNLEAYWNAGVSVFLAATALSRDCEEHALPDGCAGSFCELDEGRVCEWVARARALQVHGAQQ